MLAGLLSSFLSSRKVERIAFVPATREDAHSELADPRLVVLNPEVRAASAICRRRRPARRAPAPARRPIKAVN
jgi:hypothetical protein